MAQEIEIEYKNLLTKDEFYQLLHRFHFPPDVITQTNHYFETPDFLLREHGCALRIREINGDFTLTLKEPHPDGLLETHDPLTKLEMESWIKGNAIITNSDHVRERLQGRNIPPKQLECFGNLTTERWEVSVNGVLLVLDFSTYNETSDYELEIEAPTVPAGIQAFENLLSEYQIPKRKTANKIERFFSSLPE